MSRAGVRLGRSPGGGSFEADASFMIILLLITIATIIMTIITIIITLEHNHNNNNNTNNDNNNNNNNNVLRGRHQLHDRVNHELDHLACRSYSMS